MNKLEPSISIDGRCVGPAAPPYVVAEISGNHNGQMARALQLIEAAKAAGADAVKLQTYTADTITIDYDGPGFVIEGGLWNGRKLHELYHEAHTPWEWHPSLFEHAKKVGITCFASPFDATAVDLLERLGSPAYKIASFEIVDTPLIRYAAKIGKPLVVSTGMAEPHDIAEAMAAAREAGAGGVALLHCVSGYPTPAEDANIARIPALRETYGVPVGLSDHTVGTEVAVASVALGAVIIEKHITLARRDGGPDSAFSLEPEELKALVKAVRTAFEALGRAQYGLAASEQGNKRFRRSLYAVRDIAGGESLTLENVRSIRPGFGLPPRELPRILGRVALRNIARGTPLTWELVG